MDKSQEVKKISYVVQYCSKLLWLSMFIHIFKENIENKLTYYNNFVVEINRNLESYECLKIYVRNTSKRKMTLS